jgi:hypothetical protein
MRISRRPGKPLERLALLIGALLLAAPLLALNCEMSCAREAARTSTGEATSAQAEHCTTDEATPRGSSGGPHVPDGCGHRSDAAFIKKATEKMASGLKASIPLGCLPAASRSAFDRACVPVRETPSRTVPRTAGVRPHILRL